MKRVLVLAGLSAAMIAGSATSASAHAVSVETPSGQTNQQVLHAGKLLPPHSGAFKYHVTCNINGTNPAITIGGPTDCG